MKHNLKACGKGVEMIINSLIESLGEYTKRLEELTLDD
jgi:hypothetical protein